MHRWHGPTHPRVTRPSRHHAPDGQALVEFAFIIPVFLLLLFGTLEVGLLLKTRAAYDQAAQQAVRVAAAAGNAGDADARMLTTLQQTLPAENLDGITSVTVFDATAGAPSTAQTVYMYQGGHFVCQAAPSATPSVPCPVPTPPATYTYWDPLTRDTTVGQLDHIGLHIAYDYRGATGVLPTLHLAADTTTLIEPTAYQP